MDEEKSTRGDSSPFEQCPCRPDRCPRLAEGPNSTRHPGVTVYRVTIAQPPIPTLYAASVIIVGQGLKRSHLGKEVFEYDAGHYLVLTSPMPMLCEISADLRSPVLTVAIEIDLALWGDLLICATHPRRNRPTCAAASTQRP